MHSVPLNVEAPFHEELQCYVDHILFDLRGHFAIIAVLDGGCTDMGGAIALCERVDPEITSILSKQDGKDDTTYRKRRDKWIAYPAIGKIAP